MSTEDDDFEDFDVVVIGGGVSGLTAAYQLWKKDATLRVAVLEAKDRIGGRTTGEELRGAKGTETWDLGGQWVGVCQPHIMALLKELGLETYEEHTAGRNLIQYSRNKVHSYTGDIPALPWYSLIDLHLFMTKAEKLIQMMDPEDPSSFPYAEMYDNITFEEMKNKYLWTKAAKKVVDISGRTIFGLEPSQISALYYMMYAAAAGGLEPLISAKKNIGGQELKIKGGAWQVCHKLMEKIGSDRIHLSEPVTSITQTMGGVTVDTLTGKTYSCQRVILALPPHQTAKLEFYPSLPEDKLHVLHRMPPGNVTKFIVTYQTSFWRDAGYSGLAVTHGGDPIVDNVDSGPVSCVFDGTSHQGNPAVVGFIGGDQHIQYANLKPEERKKAVLHNISLLFGPKAKDILDYREKNWNEEPYNHGGPVSVGTPGMMTRIVPGLRLPAARLHFAGTESATVWCGFINGAVQAGYRAANEVLYNLRPQVITASDLEGTAYDNSAKKPRKRPGSTGRILRWTFAVGLLAVAAIVVRKKYCKSIF